MASSQQKEDKRRDPQSDDSKIRVVEEMLAVVEAVGRPFQDERDQFIQDLQPKEQSFISTLFSGVMNLFRAIGHWFWKFFH